MWLAAAGLWFPVAAASGADQEQRLLVALKNADPARAHGPVGMLFSRSCPNQRCGMFATCTLVLVAPEVALTAAHCVEDPDKDYRVFLPGEGLVRVAPGGVHRYCDGRPDCDPVSGDLASLRLTRPVLGIEPARRSRAVDATGLMVGFGDSDPTRADNGVLRQASVAVARCGPQTLCYGFDEESPAACNHDSGGPMFGPLGLLGLARQTEAGCVAGTGTYTDLTGSWLDDWWRAQVGNRAGSGTTSRTVLLQDCTAPGCWGVEPGSAFSFPFELDHAAGALRVTLNYALRTDASGCDEAGRSACIVDYDLALRPPGGGEGLGCRCENEFNQVSACRCEASAPGEWSAVVRAKTNRGPFQLNVQLLPAEAGQQPLR